MWFRVVLRAGGGRVRVVGRADAMRMLSDLLIHVPLLFFYWHFLIFSSASKCFMYGSRNSLYGRIFRAYLAHLNDSPYSSYYQVLGSDWRFYIYFMIYYQYLFPIWLNIIDAWMRHFLWAIFFLLSFDLWWPMTATDLVSPGVVVEPPSSFFYLFRDCWHFFFLLEAHASFHMSSTWLSRFLVGRTKEGQNFKLTHRDFRLFFVCERLLLCTCLMCRTWPPFSKSWPGIVWTLREREREKVDWDQYGCSSVFFIDLSSMCWMWIDWRWV